MLLRQIANIFLHQESGNEACCAAKMLGGYIILRPPPTPPGPRVSALGYEKSSGQMAICVRVAKDDFDL